MKKSKLCLSGLLYSLGVVIYTFLVALLMRNAEKIFGPAEGAVGITAFLLLFVFSATIVGALVLGKPVMLYFNGYKKEAVQLLTATILWLLAWLLIVFAIMFLAF